MYLARCKLNGVSFRHTNKSYHYICARTLEASAIAIRALSFADFIFISSGRIRLRLEVGRLVAIFGVLAFGCSACVGLFNSDGECIFALAWLRVVGFGMLL